MTAPYFDTTPNPRPNSPGTRRKRRRTRPCHPHRIGPARPGRFFHPNRHHAWLRLDMKPVHLGEADWLLYRRRFNPYPRSSYKHAAYQRGFITSKRMFPKPDWSPL